MSGHHAARRRAGTYGRRTARRYNLGSQADSSYSHAIANHKACAGKRRKGHEPSRASPRCAGRHACPRPLRCVHRAWQVAQCVRTHLNASASRVAHVCSGHCRCSDSPVLSTPRGACGLGWWSVPRRAARYIELSRGQTGTQAVAGEGFRKVRFKSLPCRVCPDLADLVRATQVASA